LTLTAAEGLDRVRNNPEPNMLNLNSVTLAGHLTRDPEVRVVNADRSVASFGIAINRRWKGQDGEFKEETTFVDCEAWGRTAEIIGQYLFKGSPAYLEGRLKLDSWEDKKDGQKRSKLKVVVDNIQFLGRPKGADGAAPTDGGDGVEGRASARPMAHATKPAPQPAGALSVSLDDEQPPF
jgi:single-strand DNA-binding protein